MQTDKKPLSARPKPTKLLVVEDDVSIRLPLLDAFELDGFRTYGAGSLGGAREILGQGLCDLLLLDINLPDGSGYDLLRDIRAGDLRARGRTLKKLPVVLVSGRAGEYDRIRGFEFGCDDYVVKPYSFGELRGRIAALMRRQIYDPVKDLIDLGELRIDTNRRRVELDGEEVILTVKEYALLAMLATDPERVFERDHLLAEIWGYHAGSGTRTLDAHACRLRRKLGKGQQRYVENTWGVGYRLCPAGDD
jgi:DNA-binding response OmpR family regulator